MTRLVGMMMVRNTGTELQNVLDAMSEYCDTVVVVDDRSEDHTFEVARSHPVVSGIVSMESPGRDNGDWAIPEQILLNRLYRLADEQQPDWLIRLDDDETLDNAETLRDVLEQQASDVSAVRMPRVSTWDDPEFPLMVPLMGTGRSMNASVLRHRPGFTATQPMHNLLPRGMAAHGRVTSDDRVTFLHTGWRTLSRRVERARTYDRLDPECRWNHGTPYDRGLLFGYSFTELDELRVEYSRRAEEADCA